MTSHSQKEKKKKLSVIDNDTTCHQLVEESGKSCQQKSCKQWINFEKGKNCIFLTTQIGPLTLNEIGKIYGLTRMRICQIEKGIYQKIKSQIKNC